MATRVFINGKKARSGRVWKPLLLRYRVKPFDIGRNTVSPVPKDYKVPFAFQGRIEQVTIELK